MKKNSLYFITLILAISAFSSCNRPSVSAFQPDGKYSNACPNPIYVATISKSAESYTIDTYGNKIPEFDSKALTLVALLDYAKSKYGEDVTIHNIRWDKKNGRKRTGAIFDVIKCK